MAKGKMVGTDCLDLVFRYVDKMIERQKLELCWSGFHSVYEKR